MINKLELTWVGKDKNVKIEPRILIEDKEKSYGDINEENMLIHGDNLLALKALENKFTNKIKCIYIDPPYNTGSAFEDYDDNIQHSIWLTLMNERIKILKKLLKEDGIIFISLDDNEAHYLKVLADETFGRKNFLCDIAWEKADSPRMDAKLFSTRYDHTLVYAKDIEKIVLNQIKIGEIPEHYNKTDENGKKYYLKSLRYMGNGDKREDRPNLYFPIKAPDGSDVYPMKADGTEGRWRWSKERVDQNLELIEWVKNHDKWNAYTKIYANENLTRPPETLWSFQFAGSNRNAKAEINELFKAKKKFDTPKPERLIKCILDISSNEGDWVLDSFLGSGTTCAVAHKMNRKWIGIEMGNHCYELCKVRLDKVVDGNDSGGITKDVNWQGGGGYKFYELAPTLINTDMFGEPIINNEYNAEMLASAVALHEGFKYNPSKEKFWKQSEGNEKSYLYVTTKFINKEEIENIRIDMEDDEFLVIACTAYDKVIEGLYRNIKIKKIPEMLLSKCEFGKDNYNLNIINPPECEEEEDDDE